MGIRLIPWTRRVSFFKLASLISICFADWLFYRHNWGSNLAIYVAFLLCIAAVTERSRMPDTMVRNRLVVLISGLIIALLIHVWTLPILLIVISLATLVMTSRLGWTANAYVWLRRWGSFFGWAWTQFFRDLGVMKRWQEKHPSHGRHHFTLLINWLVPVLLCSVFVILFAIANPIITDCLKHSTDLVRTLVVKLPKFPKFDRLSLWFGIALSTWALLRFRNPPTGLSLQTETTQPCSSPTPPVFSTASIIRCLMLFTICFGVENVLDIIYLWGRTPLPAGMTYAQYAHRGAYPLIATTVLAALFVLITFRPCSDSTSMIWAKRLVLVWLLQNVFLTASSLWRLQLYVATYSLSRLRVAAGIWMILIAIGLVWIAIRIFTKRSNTWLINVNILTLVVVLYTCCFINFDRIIANYNVNHCREVTGVGVPLDLSYLKHLGVESLPALIRLGERVESGEFSVNVGNIQRQLKVVLNDQLSDWRGWTLRRHLLRKKSR